MKRTTRTCIVCINPTHKVEQEAVQQKITYLQCCLWEAQKQAKLISDRKNPDSGCLREKTETQERIWVFIMSVS